MTKQTYRFIGTILLTASLLSLGGCSKEEASKYLESAADQAVSAAWDYAKEAVKGQLNDKTNPEIQSSSGTLNVHFIDVGQGDSILIQDGTHFMLVDAGENDQGDTVVNYLKEQGVTSLDYVIGTHPHSDHIGGLDKVIEAFDIGEIYLPKVADSQVPTTRTYEDVLAAVDQKGLRVNRGAAGTVLFQRDELSARLLAPNSDAYDELNSYSIVVLLTYGERKFLFMGDAESDSEQEILERFGNVTADVLKCGHHGSSTSTSQAFLDRVSPEYAVISCGRDNSYGHPHQETLERLDRKNVTVYRTDQQHTVIASCDGEKLTLDAVDISLEKD